MLVFALRRPISVPNFSKIEAHTHELWQFLQSVRNDKEEKEEKNEEILRNFADSYLGNGLRCLDVFKRSWICVLIHYLGEINHH